MLDVFWLPVFASASLMNSSSVESVDSFSEVFKGLTEVNVAGSAGPVTNSFPTVGDADELLGATAGLTLYWLA